MGCVAVCVCVGQAAAVNSVVPRYKISNAVDVVLLPSTAVVRVRLPIGRLEATSPHVPVTASLTLLVI